MVVQGPSEERSYRIVSNRHVRAGSNRVIDGVGCSAVVGLGLWLGGMGMDVSEGEGPSGAKEGGDEAGGVFVVESMRGGARSADVRVRRGRAGAMREPSER